MSRRPKAHDAETFRLFLMGIGAVVLIFGTWIAASYFEARAFNRLTGGRATTVDAMFTALRVVGQEGR